MTYYLNDLEVKLTELGLIRSKRQEVLEVLDGPTFIRDRGWPRNTFQLGGYSNTIANFEKLRSFFEGREFGVLDLQDYRDHTVHFGRIVEFPEDLKDALNLPIKWMVGFESLPGWGTVLINKSEYGDAYLYDLRGKGRREIIVPNLGNHDFVLDHGNKYFQMEWILANLHEDHNATVIVDDDQVSFWTIGGGGTGSVALSMANDADFKKKGTNGLKLTVMSGSYANPYIYHNYSPAQDWSSKKFMCIYWFGRNTGKTIRVYAHTVVNSRYFYYNVTDNWHGWKRLIIPFGDFSKSGSPDPVWTSIIRVQVQINGSIEGQVWYLDRVTIDVAQWVDMEIMVPDILDPTFFTGTAYYARFFAQYLGAYNDFLDLSNFNAVAGGSGLKFLDGTAGSTIWGDINYGSGYYGVGQGERGETVKTNTWAATYSYAYGTRYRIGLRIKMPPGDPLCLSDRDLLTDKPIYGIWLKMQTHFSRWVTSYEP